MEFAKEKTIDVVGVGNALMDILVTVDEEFLVGHGLTKGEMHLVSESEAAEYLQEISSLDTRELPGGAAANTVRGIAKLGGSAAYFGSVGADAYGDMYRATMQKEGIQTAVAATDQLTGNAITYITPDHERTFTVHLGAASDLAVDMIDESTIAKAKVVHLEAFQFEGGTKAVLEHVIKLAKRYDTLVSLDLNDGSLVRRNLDLFKTIVYDDVDIVFLNEAESSAFAGGGDPDIMFTDLRAHTTFAILKQGSQGSFVGDRQTVHTIAPVPTNVVDTTGAGDLYAAGFLHGITHGFDILAAGSMGSRIASEVIKGVGVDLEQIQYTIGH
ncbi:adenosine kinase [Candidatus Pacebacteria bacterium]|nr:adenosine kinase [Candidatus Paceibacterota bacterium]